MIDTLNSIHFNLDVSINNPLRIIFLCGSYFVAEGKEKDDKKDKRVVLRKYIENIKPNFKCIILEDKFLFRNDSEKLNYNDIDLKSLKIIELLTSMMSDKVFIFHESFSTAAEIGLFSGNTNITKKMVIFAPDTYSIEEDVISGFIKLAYDNNFFKEHNVEILRYFPGVYNKMISENYKKYHTYFVGNLIGRSLDRAIRDKLNFNDLVTIKLLRKTNVLSKNFYSLTDTKLNIVMETNNLTAYIISLFTVQSIKNELRSKRNDLVEITDPLTIRKKIVFKSSSILKKYFNEYIVRSIEANNPSFRFEDSEIKLYKNEVTVSKAIDYFVYILFGMNLLKIHEKKLVITNEMESISINYSNLIIKKSSGILSEVLNIE